MNLGILRWGFRIFGLLQYCFRNTLRFVFIFSGTNALNLDAGDALSVHFDEREGKIEGLEAFAGVRNETQLVEYETAHSGVSGIFGQGDVVLRVEIAHIQGGVKNQSSVRQRERAFDNVKFVVNLSHHLFEDVLDGDEAEDAAEFVHHESHADAACAQLEEQLAGRLSLGDNEHFPPDAAQIERGPRGSFLVAGCRIRKNPNTGLQLDK